MKKKTIKKILSVALTVCMLLTAAPLMGFIGLSLPEEFKSVVENIADSIPAIGIVADAATVASGDCGINGDNLTWTLDETGLLTIEGRGEMDFWDNSNPPPWYSYRSSINQVKLGSGVTNIGREAFLACTELTAVDLSACTVLKDIEDVVFYNCEALTEIDLSACTELTSIGYAAFDNCSALTELKIGSDICEIYDDEASIPESITFYCNAGSRAQAYARQYNRTYKALDGHAHELTATVIAPSCTLQGYTAYTCSSCNKIVYTDTFLPASGHTDSDSDGICDECNSEFVTITVSGTCGELLFWSLDDTGLLTIEGTGAMRNYTGYTDAPWYSYRSSIKQVKIGSGVTSIGDFAFAHNYATITAIELSENTELTYIGEEAFSNCIGLKEIDFSSCSELRYIGSSSFSGCKGLQRAYFYYSSSLSSIESYAFYDCEALIEIDLTGCTELYSIGEGTFSDCIALKIVCLPDCTSLRYIDAEAFSGCTALNYIDLLTCTALRYIGEEAFAGCTNMIDLAIGADCEISDYPDTLYYETVIHSYTCSVAKLYAEKYNRDYDEYFENTHIPGEWVVESEGNCVTTGSRSRSCARCLILLEEENTPALGHTWSNWTSVDDNDHTRVCSGCATVETVAHDYSVETTTATCTVAGSVKYTCNVCSHSYTISDATLPHTPGDWIVDATATCTTDGAKHKECTVCNTTVETQIITAFGHNYTSITTGATCTVNGYTTYTCSVCSDSYVGDEIVAPGHNFGAWYTTAEPSCEEYGMERRDCANCDYYENQITTILGHSYSSVIIAPTCANGGYTIYTCSRCGDSYTGSETATLSHNYSEVVTEPTCSVNGFTTFTCSSCGDAYTGNTVPALGHIDIAVVTPPTCTEKGYTTHSCTRCDSVYTDTEVDALGHDYTTAVTAPTCTEKGYTTHSCSCCDSVYTDTEVDALGHDYTAAVTAPTCTEQGYTTHSCSRCDSVYTDTEVTALGHIDENADGYCDRCGETIEIEPPTEPQPEPELSFFEKIVAFFQKIIDFFKNLFR